MTNIILHSNTTLYHNCLVSGGQPVSDVTIAKNDYQNTVATAYLAARYGCEHCSLPVPLFLFFVRLLIFLPQ